MNTNKTAIIAIVGPSGCGKTTLSRHLETSLGIPTIVSFTTRPMREGETNGVEHWFTTPDKMPPKSEMLAYTYFAGNHYWANRSDLDNNVAVTYVIDEKGVIDLINSWKDRYEVIPVLIQRDIDELSKNIDKERINRDKERVTLNHGFYKLILTNNGTLDDFLAEASEAILKLLINL